MLIYNKIDNCHVSLVLGYVKENSKIKEKCHASQQHRYVDRH
jgi:hypothetical protein